VDRVGAAHGRVVEGVCCLPVRFGVSPDHFVGENEKLGGNFKIKFFRTLQIDNEQPSGWLLKG
jgi:hypothetical protein